MFCLGVLSCICNMAVLPVILQCNRSMLFGYQGSRTVLFSLFVAAGVWCTVTGGLSSTSRSSFITAASECAKDDTVCIKEWTEKEAIGVLHRQIDDDHNGNVDLSESDEFIRDELQYEDDFDRHNVLHRGDKFISVEDLWTGWKNSEVYNWTVDQTVHWLCEFVELPQYSETFQNNAIEGPALPRLAVNSAQFMTAILGISNPIDRQKISLKAMDVVLFGPPKPIHSYLKDWMLVVSLVVAVGGCWFAYAQHRYSQSHVKEMLKEMESLQKAEDTLTEMQEKLEKAQEEHRSALMEKQTIEKLLNDEISQAKQEAERLREARTSNTMIDGDEESAAELAEKLKLAEEELVQKTRLLEDYEVRNALQEAERQLETGSTWVPPNMLQHWLQLTHEMETKFHSIKRQAAERQLREAKDVCEKIRRKRTTFMGSFRIAHGSTLDEVDHRIVSARSALSEVTNEIQERSHRWSQIEALCNFHVTRTTCSFNSVLQYTDTTSLSGSSSVIGSLAQLETNPPMGLDECDEDLPPAPLFSAITPTGIPHNLVSASIISQSVDQLQSASSQSMRQSRSVSSLQGLNRNGTSQSNLRPRVSPTATNGTGFIVGDSPVESKESKSQTLPKDSKAQMGRSVTQPSFPASSLASSAASSSSTNRPKTLPMSQSESALDSMQQATSPQLNGKKKKDFLKKSPGPPLEEEEASRSSDSTETDDSGNKSASRRRKLHIRIPKLSHKSESVKTC